VVEHLSSKHEAFDSTLITRKERGRKRKSDSNESKIMSRKVFHISSAFKMIDPPLQV
jgi:hypothetical protein